MHIKYIRGSWEFPFFLIDVASAGAATFQLSNWQHFREVQRNGHQTQHFPCKRKPHNRLVFVSFKEKPIMSLTCDQKPFNKKIRILLQIFTKKTVFNAASRPH